MRLLGRTVVRIFVWIGAVVLFIAGWNLLADWSRGYALPRLEEVIAAFLRLVGDGTLVTDVSFSLIRFTSGWLAGAALAIPLGLLTGLEKRFLGPMLEMNFNAQRAVPVIALVPLVSIWFGLSELAKVFVVAWGVFFPVWINTHNGVRAMSPNYMNAARSLGSGFFGLGFRVVIPHASESILTGARVGIGVGLICVVAAEMIGTYDTGPFGGGLGYRTQVSADLVLLPDVVACIITFGMIGYVADRLFLKVARPLIRRLAGYDPMRSTLRAGTLA